MSFKFVNTSIRFKLIVIFAITIVLPMCAINYYSYLHSSKLIRNEIQSSLYSLTSQINGNLEDWLKKMDSITAVLLSDKSPINQVGHSGRSLSDDTALLEANWAFDNFFLYTLSQTSEIQTLYVFTSDGHVYYKSNIGYMKLDYRPESEPWYQEVLSRKGKIVFFGLHTSWPLSNSHTRVFSFAREIRDIYGQSKGVILADISVGSINKLLKKTTNAYGTAFLVMDNSDNILYANKSFRMDNEQNKGVLRQFIDSGDQIGHGTIDHENVLLTYQISPYSGWKIVSITPVSAINERSRSLLQLNVIITLTSFSIFSLLVILLYLTIYRPIRRLTRMMRRVESGDWSVQIQEKSNDEIGQLSHNFNKMIQKVNQSVESEYKATILRKDAELKALQSQINPHFLYNTLQLISSISVVKKVPEINEAAKALGYMLRYSIKTSGDFVPIREELEHVESYIAIQKIRTDHQIAVVIEADERVSQFCTMKLLLQPFVENAFIHGFGERVQGTIRLSIALEESTLRFTILDDGVGMDEETLHMLKQKLNNRNEVSVFSSTDSIGISNVHSRLKLLYGVAYTLDIHSDPASGTQISITIPSIPRLGG